MARAFLYLLAAMLLSTGAHAQNRFALVVGNDGYARLNDLRNARADAVAVAAAFRQLGYEVEELHDADAATLGKAVAGLESKRRETDLVVFYFAGHGIGFEGDNWILATDFDPHSRDGIVSTAIPLSGVLGERRDVGDATVLVIVDSCSNDPFTGIDLSNSRGAVSLLPANGGLSEDISKGGGGPPRASLDTALIASTAPGGVASDGWGTHSPFTEALLKELAQDDLDVDLLFRKLLIATAEATDRRQMPWMTSSITRAVSLAPDAPQEMDPNEIRRMADQLGIK